MTKKRKRKAAVPTVYAPETVPQQARVTEMEAQSQKLLESAVRTAQQMDEFYPQMLHPEDPKAMDRQIRQELDSFRRASVNIMRARQRLFDVRDELGARWNDMRPVRKKRRLRLPTPPNAVIDAEEAASNHFTKGVGLYKLLWVFYLGSFLGVVVEVIWCLVIQGYIESRTALVYGPFNPLYGVGAVALTLALYRYRNRGPWLSFLSGMLVGSAVEANKVIEIRGLKIDTTARRVWVNGEEKNFTTKEFDLLTFLASHPNHVYTKDELFSEIWDMESIGDIATVTVHIKKIREKIEMDTSNPQYIETIWGVGYRFKM